MDLKQKAAAFLCAASVLCGTACAAPLPADRQVGILAETAGGEQGWFVGPDRDPEWQRWYYTVTDLDQDGRLEILKVKGGWDGAAPELVFRELSEDGKSLVGELSLAEGTPVPDLTSAESFGQATVLRDGKGEVYHYIFMDKKFRGEFHSVDTKYALTVKDEVLRAEALAFFNWTLSGYDGTVTTEFYLPVPGETAPRQIDQDRFDAIGAERFPGCEESGAAFWWKSGEEISAAAGNGTLRGALESAFLYFLKHLGK